MGKVKKAIAGGIAGAVTAVGTVVATGNTKDDALAYLGAALTGFAVGFIGVYVAPANTVR